HMPVFVALLASHRPASLGGRTLAEALDTSERVPAELARLFSAWSQAPAGMYRARPTLVFAVLGQARADGRLSPEDESALTGKWLTSWPLKTVLATSYEGALMSGRLRQSHAATRLPQSHSLTIH